MLAIGSSFGEQYLYIEAKPARQAPVRTAGAAATLRSLVDNFGRAYDEKVGRWNAFLAENDPAHVAVWGAGSKGVTFVNALQAGPNIAALVDVSPYKQGRFAPRTGTAVLAPEQLKALSIRSLIVMNPLYRDEIKAATEALGLTPAILVA